MSDEFVPKSRAELMEEEFKKMRIISEVERKEIIEAEKRRDEFIEKYRGKNLSCARCKKQNLTRFKPHLGYCTSTISQQKGEHIIDTIERSMSSLNNSAVLCRNCQKIFCLGCLNETNFRCPLCKSEGKENWVYIEY